MLGHVDILNRNRIAGWAAQPARPDMVVPVRITINGRRTRVEAGEMRDDLADSFAGSTGRYGFHLDEYPMPLSAFIDNEVEVVFAATGDPVPGGRAVMPAIGTPKLGQERGGRLAPVIVTSTGRSGSSLLMGRLARHPEILVARSHPHELKLLSYYALALNTLVSDADRKRSSDPETMLAAKNRFFVGYNPYNDAEDARDPLVAPFWNTIAPDILRDSFASLTQAHYERIAEKTFKTAAVFFAEKVGTSDLVRQATHYMFGELSEILLVRDPRDVICSSKSFWHRGFEESVRSLRGQYGVMSRPRVERGLRQLVLRYEDLLTRPKAAMADVYRFLGASVVDTDVETEQERAIFQTHGTSLSPAATIGRWRAELTEEEVEVANRELKSVIDAYGYQ